MLRGSSASCGGGYGDCDKGVGVAMKKGTGHLKLWFLGTMMLTVGIALGLGMWQLIAGIIL